MLGCEVKMCQGSLIAVAPQTELAMIAQLRDAPFAENMV
jgi:hypothetical protein